MSKHNPHRFQVRFFVFKTHDEGRGLNPRGKHAADFEVKTEADKFRNLNHPEGVVRIGHIETDGTVVCI